MSSEQILIIEDDRFLLRLFEKTLSAAGYQVQTAGSLEEAVEIIEHHQIDLAYCDIMIGDELSLDFLRDSISSGLLEDVIVLSSDEGFKRESIEIGVRYFLQKPISPSQITQLTSEIIG